jgi:hypothetical protein
MLIACIYVYKYVHVYMYISLLLQEDQLLVFSATQDLTEAALKSLNFHSGVLLCINLHDSLYIYIENFINIYKHMCVFTFICIQMYMIIFAYNYSC